MNSEISEIFSVHFPQDFTLQISDVKAVPKISRHLSIREAGPASEYTGLGRDVCWCKRQLWSDVPEDLGGCGGVVSQR